MTLKVYNTLTRKLEEFKPMKGKQVKAFVCGVTPYDYSHLGHAKTYTQFDIIIKYIKYKGFKVFYLQNITDIDDKIIKRANEQKTDWKTLSRKFEACYLEDMHSLGNNSVDKYARGTEYIPQIVSQVQRLIQKGYAYKISDGYYFDLSKCKEYGKLAKRTSLEENDAVSRVDENLEKRNKGDFCLWKFSKPDEPSWKTELGILGRPGWHLEDTAITETELGEQYDLHGGGMDLIFPHHEAEIAQMEAVSGKKPFVKYWLHTGFINVNKEKMSKSKGNFSTIRDVLKGYDKQVIRFLFASSHYRKPMEFSDETLQQAKNNVQKFNEFSLKLKNYRSKVKDNKDVLKLIKETKEKFEEEMDNDFETANAITSLFEFTKKINKLIAEEKISEKNVKEALEFMKEIDTIFGFLRKEESEIPQEIKDLSDKREQARKEKDFKLADKLREEIKSKGYYIDDTKEGIIIKKL